MAAAETEPHASSGKVVPSADDVANRMLVTATALDGTAANMNSDQAGNGPLLDEAVELIVGAASQGALDGVVDLRVIAPECAALMDEYRARCPTAAEFEEDQGGPADRSQAGNSPCKPVPQRRSGSSSADLEWRGRVSRIKIEDMLREEADREPTAEERQLSDRRQLGLDLLAACLKCLSQRFPNSLSPEVASSTRDIMPGVDMWVGRADDLRKAAWVLRILAKQITDRCELRLIDAATESGIPAATISRACKNGHIRSNGRIRTALRLNQLSFHKWQIEYKTRGASRAKRGRNATRKAIDYECCNCDWISEAKLLHPPDRCPKCQRLTVRPLIRGRRPPRQPRN